uniref:Uncharacterized protein n=1 Tax=Vespula pensylvanica TaxID=30213 RepID=A0A834UG23_VESPE|nr:hypothetical protein H0235_000682 [Vespula pensylvanica]
MNGEYETKAFLPNDPWCHSRGVDGIGGDGGDGSGGGVWNLKVSYRKSADVCRDENLNCCRHETSCLPNAGPMMLKNTNSTNNVRSVIGTTGYRRSPTTFLADTYPGE